MLAITHTIISLPFAVYMDNPVLIFIAAFIFHFFADTLLHWNIYPWQFKRFPFFLATLDVVAGLVATYILLGPSSLINLSVLAAIAGGNMPDVLQTFWSITPKRYQDTTLAPLKPIFAWHDHLQLETLHVGHGLISQILVIAVSFILLINSN